MGPYNCLLIFFTLVVILLTCIKTKICTFHYNCIRKIWNFHYYVVGTAIKALKQAAEMKHQLSAAKVVIKMHALSSCFISAAWFRAFYCSPYQY